MSRVQVLIIGGGVMGVSLLYHLAKSGWQDLLLVEKNDLTHGSTWHAAGLCTHFAHNPTIQELRARSVRLYRDVLPEETGATCGFHRSGAMRITRNPDRMDEFAHVAGFSRFTGYDLRLLSVPEIAELHPLARTDGLIGGIFEPDDGHVDPTLATQAMASVARKNGAEFWRQTKVSRIARDGDSWRVGTSRGDVLAKHIVNAAGTWGWEVGQMMGQQIPSVPILHQYLVTDSVPEVVARSEELPIIRDPEESWYVRQERDGLILGPYEKDGQTWSVDGVPSEFGADLLPPDLDRVSHIIEAAMARIPALETVGIKTIINGPITFTPDANPLIGPAFGFENVWNLTGSSMGVMEGGGAGWFLAHWMTKGAPPMDAIAVDPRRFGPWADCTYRIEKAIECFGLQFGVHYPHEERPAARGKRRSALHDEMTAAGAVFGAAFGWERPNWFSDHAGDLADLTFRRSNWFEPVAREVEAVQTRVALADLSVFSKFTVSGPDTLPFLNSLGCNTPPLPGRIGLIHALTPAGGVATEFTVARLAEKSAYLTSAAAAEAVDADLLRRHAHNYDVAVENVTGNLAVIGVMGPHSREVLSNLTDRALSNEAFPWLSVQDIEVAGSPTRALRVSYVGELGWELHVSRTDAPRIYRALHAAGRPFGIGHYGAYAMNSMRLEKGYPAWGSDLTTERTPFEAGLQRFVDFEGREFVGKEALARTSAWRLVLLHIEDGPVDPFYGHTVFAGDRPIGSVTSGAWGHRVGHALAFAYLREDPGVADLSVQILNDRRRAKILDAPPYDAANKRLRA